MSNTLNTPVEALELEFPLRVTEYALRRGSGGAGRHRGGDGVVRELEALDRHELLAADRAPPPRAAGADGGEPGARAQPPRRSRLEPKASGCCAWAALAPGDSGGGGYGSCGVLNASPREVSHPRSAGARRFAQLSALGRSTI
jgi:N-methylhydantoinase B